VTGRGGSNWRPTSTFKRSIHVVLGERSDVATGCVLCTLQSDQTLRPDASCAPCRVTGHVLCSVQLVRSVRRNHNEGVIAISALGAIKGECGRP
jgi:hypothetical protein